MSRQSSRKDSGSNTAVRIVGIIALAVVTMFAIAWLNPIGSARFCWALLGDYKTSTGFSISIPDSGWPEISFGAGVAVESNANEATRVDFLDCLKFAFGAPPKLKSAGQSQTLGLVSQLFGKVAIKLDPNGNQTDILNNFKFEAYSESEEWLVLQSWCKRHQKCVVCSPPLASDSVEVTVGITSRDDVVSELMPGYYQRRTDSEGRVQTAAYEMYDEHGRRIWYACK